MPHARFVLSDDDALVLARLGVAIEDHYSSRAGRPTPMDIEWAKDRETGQLFILQARLETVHSQRRPTIDVYVLERRGRVLLRGRSVGERIASGPVRKVRRAEDLGAIVSGDVLVAEMTALDWEPVLSRVAAVVTDQGGRTCHAAIISRELGIPCVGDDPVLSHARRGTPCHRGARDAWPAPRRGRALVGVARRLADAGPGASHEVAARIDHTRRAESRQEEVS
jgi:pyruvate,water dikinase